MVKSYYALLKKNSSNWYYSFDENGVCILGSSQYVRAKDSVSGKYYTMEHQYYTDPSVVTVISLRLSAVRRRVSREKPV